MLNLQERCQFARVVAHALCLLGLVGCAEGGASMTDAGIADADASVSPCVPKPPENASPERCNATGSDGKPTCEQWVKVEPADTTCGDGSQYKFFVNFTPRSDNLVVMFEPGGACWDYESCTGAARGAANPNGISDEHMANYQFLNLLRRTDDNPARDYNMVFVSYCTGDVHAGDKVATYDNPAGGPALTYHHSGLANTQKVIDYLQERFPDVPQLLVTGCSAGGLGAAQNYAFVREGLSGTQCSYLLDDSGPAFHSSGPSQQLHRKVREAWNLDTLFGKLASVLDVKERELAGNYGLLNTALADHYRSDRFALSAYRMDFNYSLYSYERFFPDATPDDIHEKYWTDLKALMRTYDSRDNLAYYVPYFRNDNCSHCVSIPPIGHDTTTVLTMPWLGSDIASDSVNMKGFVERLLDDAKPLQSYVEDKRAGADFTSEELQKCLTPEAD